MSQEQMKEAFRTVIETAYGAGKVDTLDDLFVPDFVEHQADITPPTLEGVKRSIANLRNAFPDMSDTIEEMHTDGDQALGTPKCPRHAAGDLRRRPAYRQADRHHGSG